MIFLLLSHTYNPPSHCFPIPLRLFVDFHLFIYFHIFPYFRIFKFPYFFVFLNFHIFPYTVTEKIRNFGPNTPVRIFFHIFPFFYAQNMESEMWISVFSLCIICFCIFQYNTDKIRNFGPNTPNCIFLGFFIRKKNPPPCTTACRS